MARRILDTAFWDDPDIAALSYPERLLFSCMVTDEALSDDYGHLPAHPAILKKHAFGYDSCTLDDVESWRDNILQKCRNVRLYCVNGQEYIELRNFNKWQKLRYHRKTNIPPPPESLRDLPETCANVSQDSAKVRTGSVGLCSAGKGRVGKGSVGEIPEKEVAAASPFQEAVTIWTDWTGDSDDLTRQKLVDAAEKYGDERLLYAVREAHNASVKRWAYVEAILKNNPRGPPSKEYDNWKPPTHVLHPVTGEVIQVSRGEDQSE